MAARLRGAVRATAGAAALACWAAAAAGDPAGVVHRGPPPPAEVRRVVALAPSLTELVLALGAQERLLGVTRFDDDPRVAALPRVGGFNDPEPEMVLRLKPDLVLAQPAPENRGPVEQLARLGVPVDAWPLTTLADVDRAIGGVAQRLGLEARGAALRAELSQRRQEARARAAGRGQRVLLVFGLEPLVVAGESGFAGELLADTGAANAAGDARSYLRLSAEAAVLARPTLVLLCGMDPPGGRRAIPGLDAPLLVLRSPALMHPGPRLAEALGDLEAALAQAPSAPDAGTRAR